ncbi:hypothetical protein LX81_03322 [Palleronia aestuarii]|uniref:Uncharacterized protein n=1 Tax=Palleronia aestuarii TaxID=568105 RepID=A0A2W7N8B5_9RHOB|nr:hypothetical protein [Palleronia aestuarii]PZX13094.1 hypothetical protein LX81_03322 [Palleronia aestuarii]
MSSASRTSIHFFDALQPEEICARCIRQRPCVASGSSGRWWSGVAAAFPEGQAISFINA